MIKLVAGGVGAALVVAGAVYLVHATRESPAEPALPSSVAAGATSAAPRVPPVRAPSRSAPAGGDGVDRSKFVAPEGAAPMTFTGERAPVPATGGFAAWTGREGMRPGELEAFAADAHVSIEVALEQRRSIELMDRSSDRERLGKVLGVRPTSAMMDAIDAAGRDLHVATANAQVGARDGSLSDAASIATTREAEARYRAAVLSATGLDDTRFDRLFAP